MLKKHLKNGILHPNLQSCHLLSLNQKGPTRNSILRSHLQMRANTLLTTCHMLSLIIVIYPELYIPAIICSTCHCLPSPCMANQQANPIKLHCCQRKSHSVFITRRVYPTHVAQITTPSVPFSLKVVHENVCYVVSLHI